MSSCHEVPFLFREIFLCRESYGFARRGLFSQFSWSFASSCQSDVLTTYLFVDARLFCLARVDNIAEIIIPASFVGFSSSNEVLLVRFFVRQLSDGPFVLFSDSLFTLFRQLLIFSRTV